MIESESVNETTDGDHIKIDKSKLKTKSKGCFNSDEWEGKSKGHVVYDKEGNEKFECLICKADFKFKQRLDNHIAAIHEGNQPFLCYDRDGKKKYQCLTCKFEFNEKASVVNHISAVHEGIKPHKCSLCDFAAVKKFTLNMHVSSVHEGKKPFACDICGNSFKRKQILRNHMVSVHDEKKPFECTTCLRTFLVERNLKKHNCNDSSSKKKEKVRKKEEPKLETNFDDFYTEDLGGKDNNVQSLIVEQLNQILQNAQVLVNNQDLNELQSFLNELNVFLLNLKIVLDTTFTTGNLESHEENNFVQFVKPLSALYGIKNKVILELTNPVEIEIREDFANVKIEVDDYDYRVNDFKENSLKVKREVEDPDYIINNLHYNENDPANDSKGAAEDDQEDDNGIPKSATHSFYKKKGMSKGYKDSYPISNEEYNKHILNGAPFTCPKCDKPCKRQLSFDYHLASKCMGIKMIWPKWEKVQKDKFMCLLPDCPEAGKILGKHTHAWKHHYEVHAPQAKGNKSCEYCGKQFTVTGKLNSHIKEVHTKEYNKRQPMQCKICGKTVNSDYLKFHEWSHFGEKPIQCELCDYRCQTTKRLKVHMTIHQTEKNEICDTCGKSFKTKESLKIHQASHVPFEERKTYFCKICGKVLWKPTSHKAHEEKCSAKAQAAAKGKVTNCAHCEYATVSPAEMLEHLYATHRHLLDGKFCERCGKNFKRSDTLKGHMEVHLDLREKCPMENCGMMVRNLRRHLFIAHKQGHLYKCPDCPQEMASLMGLELHRQRIHGLPKQPKMHQSVAMHQFKIEND